MYTPPKPKSRFITGLGIALIIMSAKMVLISLIYSFSLSIALQGHSERIPSPELADVFLYLRMGLGVMLLVGASFLASAIGLFYRKNWARMLAIGLFFLVITAILSGIASEWIWMDNRSTFIFIKIISLVIAGGLTFLFGWLIKKLNSEEIVKEFHEPVTDTFSL